MSDFINSVDAIGDDAVMDGIINGTITELRDNRITCVGSFAFCDNKSLQILDLPEATEVKNNALGSCSALTSVNFPKVEKIGSYAMSSLYALKTLSFPSLTYAEANAFRNSSGIQTFDCPELTGMNQSAFLGCSGVTSFYMPKIAYVGDSAFERCSSLTMMDLLVANVIYACGFMSCAKLTALILRTEAVVDLKNTNALSGTPIASGTGYVYVPSANLENYKTATNWSTYAGQFRVLEDYTVDGTRTGAMDKTKM